MIQCSGSGWEGFAGKQGRLLEIGQEMSLFMRDLAENAGVPLDWMINVINAQLIEYIFNKKGVRFAEGMFVRIPLDKGLEP